MCVIRNIQKAATSIKELGLTREKTVFISHVRTVGTGRAVVSYLTFNHHCWPPSPTLLSFSNYLDGRFEIFGGSVYNTR